MMNSPNYKERFKAEYFQLQIRIEGLTVMLEKYRTGTLTFTPSCSYGLLKKQLDAMNFYRACLEERALIENIDLKD